MQPAYPRGRTYHLEDSEDLRERKDDNDGGDDDVARMMFREMPLLAWGQVADPFEFKKS